MQSPTATDSGWGSLGKKPQETTDAKNIGVERDEEKSSRDTYNSTSATGNAYLDLLLDKNFEITDSDSGKGISTKAGGKGKIETGSNVESISREVIASISSLLSKRC